MLVPLLANLIDRLSAVPPIWHVLWAGLACLSLALVVLSWTRWGQSKPIHKCAVLSLLAHVLLACFATTVKIVASAESSQTPATVHVALVSGEEGTTDQTASAREIQPWEGLQSGPVSRPEPFSLDRPQHDGAPEPIALAESFERVIAPDPEISLLAPGAAPASQSIPTESPQSQEPHESPLQPAPVEVPDRAAAAPHPTEPLLTPQEISRSQAVEETAPFVSPEAEVDEWQATEPATTAVDHEPPKRLLPPIEEPLPDDLQWLSPQRRPEGVAGAQNVADAAPLTTPEPGALGSGPVEASPEKPSVYRHRHPKERARLVQDHGGTEETEAAVHRALEWLSRAQSPDGRWDAVRHGAGREMAVYGHDRQGAGANADTGVTGLALLAFLGAGHTHVDGNYRQHVQKGLDFLIQSQNPDGNLAGSATLYAQMYCHAMATFALSEAYAMTCDAALVEPIRSALAYTARAQHAGGGWRYRPGDPGDTSQLGWQLMALASAELAGLTVPEPVWRRAEAYLQSVSRGRAGGLAAYQPGTGVSRTMSAEATYCKLLLADRHGQLAAARDACDETAEYLRSELPGIGKPNLYYWYYATLLLHVRQNDGPKGRDDWRMWNEALQRALLASQHRTGPLEGAWGSDTVWGGYGGRVYTTALAALCLETYYRYLPFLEDGGHRAASRPGLLHQRAFDTRD
jgi:hypothetical protein